MANDISIVQLIWHASFWAQLLMLLLFLMLFLTIFIFGKKMMYFQRTRIKVNKFKRNFWQSQDLKEFYSYHSEHSPESIERIFVDGFHEFLQFKPMHYNQADVIVLNCRRAMEAAMNRVVAEQESHLNILATIGSSAPYIGLLGTVVGIMRSFIALGGVHQASIASVAPGIAEALIATAIGLLAAIPSVLAYNYFIAKSDVLVVEYEAFIEEFANILQRQIAHIQSKKSSRT